MFFLQWLCFALGIVFVSWVIPGIEVDSFLAAMFVAVIIGLINVFIKPLVMLLTLPINVVTLGLFTLVINALLLMLAGAISPGFEVEGFWSAFFGSIVLALFSIGVNAIGE